MKKILLVILLISSAHSQINNLHTQENIRKFADHLFHEKDYLRSVFEYEKLSPTDTLEFKIALAYQIMEKYDIALQKFSEIEVTSVFYEESKKEYYKTLFNVGKYEYLQKSLVNNDKVEFQRLLYLSYLFSSNELPDQKTFFKPFPDSERDKLLSFYNYKEEPPIKSSLTAGIMSAIIPGSGKIYLGEIGDGITSFIATSLIAFLSYDNFNHNHDFRGWLFGGLGFFFYAGNIYGSVAATQIYNAKINYEYESELKEYLKNKNYFLPENEILK